MLISLKRVRLVAAIFAFFSLPATAQVNCYVSRVDPNYDTAGGTVTIHGWGFTGTTSVNIGNGYATSFRVLSDTLMTAVCPSTPGESFGVFNANGYSPGMYFALIGTPAKGAAYIGSFSPTYGHTGDTVTIRGRGFTNITNVTIGGQPVAFFTIVSDTVITAVVSGPDNGALTVRDTLNKGVNTTGGFTSPLLGFTNLSTYTGVFITSYSPVPSTAGSTVTIHGINLGAVNDVEFGPWSATSFTVVSPTTVTAVVPRGTPWVNKLAVGNGSSYDSTGFSWVLPDTPKITSFSPLADTAGGTVTIKGTHFTGTTAVLFGADTAASLTVVSDTVIKAVVSRAGASGTVQVVTPGVSSTSTASFTYLGLSPRITSFAPTSAGKGDTVILKGQGLTDVKSVFFGDAFAASFQIVSDTVIAAVVGSGTSGNISFSGKLPNGTIVGDTLASPLFTFVTLTPTIAAFSPSSDTSGGTVTLHGTHFTGATAVFFGGDSAASFSVLADTLATAVVGKGASGSVQLVTPNGTATAAATFTFLTGPSILSFIPPADSAGATVFISGSKFTGATAVYFGGVAATSFTVRSDTSISAVVPSNIFGHAITVVTPVGTDSLGGFTYLAPAPGSHAPLIHAFTPASDTAGGTVIIDGANFSTVTAVSFGSVPAASFTIVSDTMIEAVVGQGATGTVIVFSPQGSDTSAAVFTYTLPPPPSITGFSPASDTVGGVVTITGISLGGTTQVIIGNVAAASFTVVSSTEITAVVARGASTGRIVVYASGDTLQTTSDFTVLSSIPAQAAITSFSPQADSTGGIVVIRGTHFTGVTAVALGGTWSNFVIESDTMIWVTVGTGSTGPITLIQPGEDTVVSTSDFTYLQSTPVYIPQVLSFSPTSDTTGGVVTILGTHFTRADRVTFGGSPASSFTVVSDTLITAVVGQGSTGLVSVSTSAGTGSSDSTTQFTYVYTPPPAVADTFAMISFTGSMVNGQLQLTWVTQYDENIVSYQLERATDSTGYTSIYTVRSQQIAGVGIDYAYTDPSPVQGNNYYRLTATDTLGKTAGTWLTTVNVPLQPHVTALPNPATGSVYVKVPYSVHKAVIQLVDLNGKVTKTMAVPMGAYQVRIDLTGVPSGLYILTWQDGTSRTQRNIMVH
ncbi:T9SS type A sorting domain-containing protein [Dinghuibacter silviterrae]|uniref:Putative secreted protein (Por secretion system target) n=1 Tax=Dinghuibacter silviterrae TaxID=1539049 RepID=A0A4R8DH87_9BACT|nr:T9SS type A sorting domain-containing protein [Dinghuibacter silviterrae]TDW96867.1 putative secreted protein (Por secretion system target) [Dinghuibacter silviterrae]